MHGRISQRKKKNEYRTDTSKSKAKKSKPKRKGTKREIDYWNLSDENIQWLEEKTKSLDLSFIYPEYTEDLESYVQLLRKYIPNDISDNELITLYITDSDIRESFSDNVENAVQNHKDKIMDALLLNLVADGILLDENIIIKIVISWFKDKHEQCGIFNMDVRAILSEDVTIDDSDPRGEILDYIKEYIKKYCTQSRYERIVSKILSNVPIHTIQSIIDEES